MTEENTSQYIPVHPNTPMCIGDTGVKGCRTHICDCGYIGWMEKETEIELDGYDPECDVCQQYHPTMTEDPDYQGYIHYCHGCH